MGRSTGTEKLEIKYRDGIQCNNRKLRSTSLTLPPSSLPPEAGSSPRAQMLSVNTEIPERKQGFTAASCTHSQYRQRPGARRGQPAPHKHRPPCLLSEPLVLLPGSGWAWF